MQEVASTTMSHAYTKQALYNHAYDLHYAHTNVSAHLKQQFGHIKLGCGAQKILEKPAVANTNPPKHKVN